MTDVRGREKKKKEKNTSSSDLCLWSADPGSFWKETKEQSRGEHL